MVCSASELEVKYGSHGGCDSRNCRNIVERERGAGGSIQDARAGQVLSQPVVSRGTLIGMKLSVLTICCSWSKQIIEHERAVKEKERQN